MRSGLIRQLLSIMMAFTMVVVLCVPAMASELETQRNDNTTEESQEAFITEDTTVHTPIEKDVSITMSMEDLISNSENVALSDTTIVGTYNSPEYDGGFIGYTYSISFDWVADVSNGEYVFAEDGITNAEYDINLNYFLLPIMGFSYYSYQVTKWEHSFSDDMKNVTFKLNYNVLTSIPGSILITSTPVANTLTIAFSDVHG